jgi:hypothetical protein
MRVDALEVAQHAEMERAGLYAFRVAFAQPRQMTIGAGELGGSDLRLFADQRACNPDVVVDEDAEGKLEVVHDELVISWARYAEAFAYDEDSGVFSLDNPS